MERMWKSFFHRTPSSRRSSFRRLVAESLEQRNLLATVAVRFEFLNTANQPVTSLQLNEDFTLRTFVRDVRSAPATPAGIFQAYMNVNYPSARMTSTGSIIHGTDYSSATSGNLQTAGVISEVGGLDSNQVPPVPAGAELLLFSAPFRATSPGQIQLSGTPTGNAARSVILFDSVSALPFSEIDFIGTTIEVVSASVNLSRTSGLVTNETGTTDTFTAVLSVPPTSNVSFNLSSSNTSEGIVSPQSVTFTSSNWNVPQTITVSGVDDNVDDGAVGFTIVTSVATSTDARYSNLVIPDVGATNQNNDTSGFTFSRTEGLTTSENGTTDSFNVRLNSQPTANVTISLSSNNVSEATVSPSLLTFTTGNWNQPQVVTAQGVDDLAIDGGQNFTIITSSSSSDPKYSALNPPDVSGVNSDNDVVTDVVLSRTSGLITSETGASDTFTARLTAQPTANVSFTLASSNSAEGTVTPTTLVFTPANWNFEQTVTVTGVNDLIEDGDVSYSIMTSSLSSTDPRYHLKSVADIGVTNRDQEDIAGYTFSRFSGLTTSEAGTSDAFTVRLNSQPVSTVIINLSVSNAEATVTPTSLSFDGTNWNQPQTVTVRGVDDGIIDGSQNYTVVTTVSTSDAKYAAINPPDVLGTNSDNDVASIQLSRTSGLVTTENGGQDSFTVRLSHQPANNVSISFVSGNTNEGTPSPGVLTFSSNNWDQPQTITLTGINDDLDDGDQAYVITGTASSVDSRFQGLAVPSVSATNNDNDSAGITVAPTSGLLTSETGTTATFQIVLNSRPASNVTLGLASANPSEVAINTTGITFTPQNWNVGQVVTVTGLADDVVDGDQMFTITTQPTTSTDLQYDGVNPPDVTGLNINTNRAEILVGQASGLTTTEAGGTATFTVRLSARPAANVTVPIASQDPTEGSTTASSLLFTSSNWQTPQTVTVRGNDDRIADGSVNYTVSVGSSTSTDLVFQGLSAPVVNVVNTDDDVAGIQITPTTGLQTSENGDTASFTIILTSQPIASVTIPLSSSDTTEGTVSSSNVVFTEANWNVSQTITVTGVDDFLGDGDIPYQVLLAAAASTDGSYSGRDAMDVALVNLDNDVPGFSIRPVAGLMTSESGSTSQFEIVLTQQPVASVTVPVASSRLAEGTLSLSQIEFSTSNWNVPQIVTITGADDGVVDGDQTYLVVISPAQSTDPFFSGIDPRDLIVVNADNDTARLVIEGVAEVAEGNGGTTLLDYLIRLDRPVISGFSVIVTSSDGTARAGTDYQSVAQTVAFTGTGNETHTVRLTVNGDATVEPHETLRMQLGSVAGLSNAVRDRLLLPESPIATTIRNDDQATVTLATLTSRQAEGTSTGSTAYTVTATVSAAVEGGFSIPLSSSDGTALVANGDYTPVASTLTFIGVAGEQQLFTIQVAADNRVEPDENFSISLGTPQASLVNATDILTTGSPLSLTIENDDFPRLVLTEVTALKREGTGTGTTRFEFTVALTGDVLDSDGFSVPFSFVNGTAINGIDFESVSGTLQFTGLSGETKAIVLNVVQDAVVEADETFTIQLGDPVDLESLQPLQIPVRSLQTTIEDDDAAAVSLSVLNSPLNEGTGPGQSEFRFRVLLDHAVEGGFSIPFNTVDESATIADGDYVGKTEVLRFVGTAGESKEILVTINRDAKVEGNENLQVTLGELNGLQVPTGSISIPSAPLTATIANDDTATIHLSGPTQVSEGSPSGTTTATYQVRLQGEVAGPFSFPYSTRDGTATVTDGDYLSSQGAVSFTGTSGQVQSFTVAINPDNKVERNEAFEAILGSISGLPPELSSQIMVSQSSVSTIIANDDSASVSLTGPTRVSEGTGSGNQHAEYIVRLSAPVQGGFSLGYRLDDGTATVADNDYVRNTDSVAFFGNANEEQIVRLEIVQDAKVERDESLQIALGELANANGFDSSQLTIDRSPLAVTITNDDSATLEFISGASSVLSQTGQLEIGVRLVVSGGGFLSEPVVLNVAASPGSATPQDFSLVTPTLTFPTGSSSGVMRNVRLNIANNDSDNLSKTLSLSLSLATSGNPPSVSLGSQTLHQVTILNDPLTGVLGGTVWVDGNRNHLRENLELGIPGVVVRLQGTDLQGRVVEGVTVTDEEGLFRFTGLPGGTYSLAQSQPSAFIDGVSLSPDSRNGINQTEANRIDRIVLARGQQRVGFHFTEQGIHARHVNQRNFVSRPLDNSHLRELVARSTEEQGEQVLATAIRGGKSISMLRIADEVTFQGSSSSDRVLVTPATSKQGTGRHRIEFNGLIQEYTPGAIRSVVIDGGAGPDQIEFRDSIGDDDFLASADRALLTTNDLRVEAIAFELVRAISESGGSDDEETLLHDYALTLHGPW
jgi:hypothetical protein